MPYRSTCRVTTIYVYIRRGPLFLSTPRSGEVCRGIRKYPWQYWLELAKAADKYLAPSLVLEAVDAMMMHGFSLTVRVDICGKDSGPSCDVDSICDILDAL